MDAKKAEVVGGRWFDNAENAAAAARVKATGGRLDVHLPALFVLRMAHPSPLFAWEVRKFTAIVLARGEGYATEMLARAAGQRGLIAITSGSEASDG